MLGVRQAVQTPGSAGAGAHRAVFLSRHVTVRVSCIRLLDHSRGAYEHIPALELPGCPAERAVYLRSPYHAQTHLCCGQTAPLEEVEERLFHVCGNPHKRVLPSVLGGRGLQRLPVSCGRGGRKRPGAAGCVEAGAAVGAAAMGPLTTCPCPGPRSVGGMHSGKYRDRRTSFKIRVCSRAHFRSNKEIKVNGNARDQ